MTDLPSLLIDHSARHIEWPDVNKDGRALPVSRVNVAALMHANRIELRHNVFTDAIELHAGGHVRRLGDPEINRLWSEANQCAMQAKHGDFARLLDVVARQNPYHPINDYLASLKWDGTLRCATWLSVYLGAADTPLNRAIGNSVLTGMVRRVQQPGCRHDTMMVLEGPQGAGKSRAMQTLGGPWHGDQLNLGLRDRETIEQTQGVWLGEIAELAGQRRNEVETIKAFISRREDKGRPAYGRMTALVPRQFVLVGTTNDLAYLKDSTGGRRFLPVTVGKINLESLARDRDQLFAEAFDIASFGPPECNAIPENLWADAADVQESRREIGAIEERVRELIGPQVFGYIQKSELRRALGEEAATRWLQPQLNALTAAMRKLGWDGKDRKQRLPGGGDPVPVYERRGPDGTTPGWLFLSAGQFRPGTTNAPLTTF